MKDTIQFPIYSHYYYHETDTGGNSFPHFHAHAWGSSHFLWCY